MSASTIGEEVFATAVGERAEEFIRTRLEHSMRSALGAGGGPQGILKVLFTSIGSSEVFKEIQKLPGVNSSDVSIVLAALLEKTNFIDKLMPGNKSPTWKLVKFFLKDTGPHLILALGNGLSDGMKVEAELGKHMSSEAVLAENRKAPWDSVFCPEDPDWVGPPFGIPIRQDGEFVMHADDKTPCCDKAFEDAYRMWQKHYGFSIVKKQVPDGNNKDKGGQPRMKSEDTRVPKVLAGVFLSPEAAMSRLDSSGSDELLALLLSTIQENKPKDPPKAKTWAEKLTPETLAVMMAFSRTQKDLSWLDQVTAENLVKHLEEKKIDNVYMTQLGVEFKSKIGADGKLSSEDYLTMVAYTDMWMGAEVTKVNKIRLLLARTRASMKSGSMHLNEAIPTFFVATGFMWFFLMVVVTLFIGSTFLFVAGAVHDVNQPLDLVFTTFKEGRSSAFSATVVGAWCIMLLLTLLSFVQSLHNWVTVFVPGASQDWIVQVGRKISAFIGVYGSLIALMVLAAVPLTWRSIALLITPLGAYGIAMMLASIGFDETIRHQIYRATKWFAWIVVILPIIISILFAVLSIFGVTPVIAGEWIKELFHKIAENKVLQSILLGGLVLSIGYPVLRKIEWTKATADGTVYESAMPNWIARILLLCALLFALAYPWVDMPKNNVKIPEPTAPAVVDPNAKPASPNPKSVLPDAATETRKSRSTKSRPEPKSTSPGLCDGLSFTACQELKNP